MSDPVPGCATPKSIASVAVHPAAISVGASGAIFGLFGVLLALLTLKDPRIAAIRSTVLVNVAIFVGLNLFIGTFLPAIDNAAHVGGLAADAVLGLLIYVQGRLARDLKV